METQDIFTLEIAGQSSPTRQMPSSAPMSDSYASAAPASQRRLIAELAGQLYEDGSTTVRSRMLEILLRPMSVFSLISVAGGLFAQIKVSNAEWQGFQMRAEDIRRVGTKDVVALVELVQQISGDAVRSLTIILATSPALAETTAARALQQIVHPTAYKAPAARLNS